MYLGGGLEPPRLYSQRILSLLLCREESAILSQNITKNYEVSSLITTWHEKILGATCLNVSGRTNLTQ